MNHFQQRKCGFIFQQTTHITRPCPHTLTALSIAVARKTTIDTIFIFTINKNLNQTFISLRYVSTFRNIFSFQTVYYMSPHALGTRLSSIKALVIEPPSCYSSSHVRESVFWNPRSDCSRNLKSRKYLHVECGILLFGIRNLTLGIQNPGKQNFLESGIQKIIKC